MDAPSPCKGEVLDPREDLPAVGVVAGFGSAGADFRSVVAGAWAVLFWRCLRMVADINWGKFVAARLVMHGGGADEFAVRWFYPRVLRHRLEGGGAAQLVDLLRDRCLHLVGLLQKVEGRLRGVVNAIERPDQLFGVSDVIVGRRVS